MMSPAKAQPELPPDDEARTVTDTLGRMWTITAETTVVGMRWHVYLHRAWCHPHGLELMHPGGVANGWTEMERTAGSILALLAAWMKLFDAEPAGGEAPR